jgi:8-oxo-dGTP pyrophosphatase MutT (NUDIX family)
MSRSDLIDRPTARVIVLNDRGKLLLFRIKGDGDPFWIMPGGAVEADESYEDAARRELKEETGIEVATLGPWVWKGSNIWTWGEKLFAATTASTSFGCGTLPRWMSADSTRRKRE